MNVAKAVELFQKVQVDYGCNPSSQGFSTQGDAFVDKMIGGTVTANSDTRKAAHLHPETADRLALETSRARWFKTFKT